MTTTPTPQQQRRKIKVDLVSDAICPFCYIGYKNFEAGVLKTQQAGIPIDIELEFKPFLLDPSLTTKPQLKTDRYARKFGESRVEGIHNMMKEKGKQIGIDFSFGGTISQTHDYHRLLTYAYLKGGESLQRPLVQSLFTAYFEKEQDPGQRSTLISHAVEQGIFSSTSEATAFFDSPSMDQEVKQAYKWAMRAGIQGVPFFVMNDTYAVSGAQPPEAFFEVFQTLAKGGQFGHKQAEEGTECPIQDAMRNERISREAADDGKACIDGDTCPAAASVSAPASPPAQSQPWEERANKLAVGA